MQRPGANKPLQVCLVGCLAYAQHLSRDNGSSSEGTEGVGGVRGEMWEGQGMEKEGGRGDGENEKATGEEQGVEKWEGQGVEKAGE